MDGHIEGINKEFSCFVQDYNSKQLIICDKNKDNYTNGDNNDENGK